MKGFVFWASVGLAITGAVSARANSPQLKGDYGVTGATGCLVSASVLPAGTGGGFNPVTLQPNPGSRVFSHHSDIEGIRHFNGDGTGYVNALEVGFVPPPTPGAPGPYDLPGLFPPSAFAQKFSFSFTYQVNDDGSFQSALAPGSFVGTFTAGPRAGQTYTIDQLNLTGLVSNDAKTLTAAHIAPEIETVTYSNGEVRQEVCDRSRVLIWMQNNYSRLGMGRREPVTLPRTWAAPRRERRRGVSEMGRLQSARLKRQACRDQMNAC